MNNWGKLGQYGLLFLFWILSVYSLWRSPLILMSLQLILVVSYFIFKRRKGDEVIFIVAAIIGPLGEAVVSSSGLWTYAGQTVFGIPYWLPLAWGITAVIVYRFVEVLRERY